MSAAPQHPAQIIPPEREPLPAPLHFPLLKDQLTGPHCRTLDSHPIEFNQELSINFYRSSKGCQFVNN